jgi:carboxylate-amine ligase
MEFSPCENPTVGVEWELQLLDPVTLDLLDGIMPLMEFFPDTSFIKPEYIQSCVELTSCVADVSEEAVDHIAVSLQKILQRCGELEMSACGAGTHAFCRRLALITPIPRYLLIEKGAGYLAHTQITFSTHVHVGMKSGDEAMRTMTLLVPAIPAFVALSANSPFWRGHETGHAAYRHRILAAAPNYGLPPRFHDWQDYDSFLGAAIRCGMIRTFKDVHWDLRPHPDFGTLEIRAMDAASDIRTLHALVAFARSMVRCMADAPARDVAEIIPLELPHWVATENRYRAAHLGLAADYIIDESGRHRPLCDLVGDLIEFCKPTAEAIGESTGLALAEELLQGVPGSERQLQVYERHNSTRAVVENLQQALLPAN